MTRIEAGASQTAYESGDKHVYFAYDYMGRRIRKRVQTYNGSSWPETSDELFVYDGWNVVMVIDANATDVNAPEAVTRKYAWGLDLSGTIHGAGGIGGLLAVDETQGTYQGTYWFFYDANGNVGQLVKTIKDGEGIITGVESTLAAHYEYDPCGNVITSSGAYKDVNPFKFSTKWFDDETGLGYWGIRYYEPRRGRWTSQDPIGERGGWNLYAYTQNAPTQKIDLLGRLFIPATPSNPGIGHIPDFGGGPSGLCPLYVKIIAILLMRNQVQVPWLMDLFSPTGELYELTDEFHELRSHPRIRTKMNQFYLTYLNSLSLRGGWHKVEIPFQSAPPIVGPFYMDTKVFGDTGFWLNGAHDVRVHGSVEVCREGDVYLFRNLEAKWQWHDEIDGRSYLELYRDHAPWYSIVIEGSYDWYFDKIRDMDYYVIIHFEDKAEEGKFPPGVEQ
jgi:RHS repeat-associated protein